MEHHQCVSEQLCHFLLSRMSGFSGDLARDGGLQAMLKVRLRGGQRAVVSPLCY